MVVLPIWKYYTDSYHKCKPESTLPLQIIHYMVAVMGTSPSRAAWSRLLCRVYYLE